MTAAMRGNQPLVELLLERGAKRELLDSGHKTAPSYALEDGHSDTAALLQTGSAEFRRNIVAVHGDYWKVGRVTGCLRQEIGDTQFEPSLRGDEFRYRRSTLVWSANLPVFLEPGTLTHNARATEVDWRVSGGWIDFHHPGEA